MELSKTRRTVGKEKMSFSVRFNAEDEEVEGLCSIPTKVQSTGSTDEQLKTPEQSSGNSHYLGLFGLKRSSSLDAESSPCDSTIKRLDSFLSDIKEGLWRSESGGDLSIMSKKTDDSGQDDDSISMISNEIDEAEEEEQIQYNIIDRNLFGIRRRYTKLTEKNIAIDNIETAKDALEDLELKSNTPVVIQHGCSEHEHLKPKDKVKYVILILFGITGCYISYKYMPMYLNTFVLGGLIAYKFRHVLEIFTKEDYKKNQFLPNLDYIPDNEASIIRSLKSLYDLDPSLMLFKGWMNQFLYDYRPETYRLSLTISVYVRLKGSILIMSYPYYKVPKRSLYNETKPKLLFVKECMYKLSKCNITLLPQNLVNKRKWSKKYPICIELNSESLIGVRRSLKFKKFIQGPDEWMCKDYVTPSSQAKSYYEEMLECGISDMKDDYDFKNEVSYSENKQNEKKKSKTDVSLNDRKINESEATTSKSSEKLTDVEENNEVDGEWKTDSDKIYLFARNDPEKELWFHRLNLSSAFDVVVTDELTNKKKQNVEEHNKFIKAYLGYLFNVYELSNYPVLMDVQKKKENLVAAQINDISDEYLWLNMLLGRVCFDYLQNPKILEMIADKFQKKLNAIRLPKVMDILVIRSLCFGKGEIPTIRSVSKPWVDHRGIWFEVEITYNGTFQASVDTKLNLMKLKKEEARQQKDEVSAVYDSNQEDSGETSNDEGHAREDVNFAERLFEQQALNDPPPPQGSRITRFMENCSSGFLELKFVRKVFENVAKKELTLVIDVKQLVGTLIINLPPPPTDRVWVSFKGSPQINFEAKPKVNDTNVPLMDVLTKALHNILIKEFEKVIVLPNMIDFSIPLMNSEY
ncbi:testis-expressed protein 2 isoform X2 [Metopolophium dirhodum]|uniref:testis-expressed protein 2 isoform X2 n=1 Tax=Metopolophium dirhodum TaxID=44670 RepID=UPI00298FDEF5|nr:testis-expressed protein 2 isoform X2 [Metopolophium dirhodum]